MNFESAFNFLAFVSFCESFPETFAHGGRVIVSEGHSRPVRNERGESWREGILIFIDRARAFD